VAIIYTGSKLTDSGTTLGAKESAAETADGTDNTGGDEIAAADTPGDVIGDFETFTEYDTEICKDGGKPVVYLFSTTWCPHCEWIKDTFDSWAKDNADKAVIYHWELDTSDNTLTDAVETEVPAEHQAVYEEFNPSGSIPTFVFGCRYGRVGNGYEAQDDLDAERDSFDKVLEELT
jgi:thiol-disulfide isomerase/thioredoxin